MQGPARSGPSVAGAHSCASTPDTARVARIRVIAVGLLSLAVAMGIGRFAYTPLVPAMLAGQGLDLQGAAALASSNYLGYLVGALACTFGLWRRFLHDAPARMIRASLVAVCILTALMAVRHFEGWVVLRFLAGVASAVAFVYTSTWCLEHLSRLGAMNAGAMVYAGPGIGIAVTGLCGGAMLTWQVAASSGWFWFGVLAAVGTGWIWPRVDAPAGESAAAAGASAAPAAAPIASPLQAHLLAIAYGIAGFGYIISATFLPVIARAAVPGSRLLDFFWPLFGIGTAVGAVAVAQWRQHGDFRLRLAACYVLQAAGVAASVLWPSDVGLALGTLLLGLPFTAITYFAVQEARRLRPQAATAFIGYLTVLYGIGQIAGPPLASWLVVQAGSPSRGFAVALWAAAAALAVGALLFLLLRALWPASDAGR